MAVSIDTVYQKVMAFANKEQRGYITPQQFNLFATQAQIEIFEQYFYDINQWSRAPGNDTEYSDMLSVLQEKISIFEVRTPSVTVSNGVYNHTAIPALYKLGSVHTTNLANQKIEVQEVNNNEWYNMQAAPLTRPTRNQPVYVNRRNGLNIYPGSITAIDISYIKKPISPNWGYVVVHNKTLYNDNTSADFELHASEESELVYRILAYAGISIEKPEVLQAASQGLTSQIQQEKQ